MTSTISIPELRTKMNACGSEATPFLFAVDFDLEEAVFIERPLASQDVLFRMPSATNVSYRQAAAPVRAAMQAHPIAYNDYLQRFRIIQDGLMRGDSYLCNLTVRTPVTLNVGLREVYLQSHSLFGLYVPNRFVCFSPERFVRIRHGRIMTSPMKGTIEASVPNAVEVILADPKETAEHCTVVDLLRNDLGIVADDVRVDRFRYIDTLHTNNGDILQVSSDISAALPDGYAHILGDIILSLLPAGSICGAPKCSTVAMIHRAEPEPRGFYAGVFGYFDGHDFDSAVMIRFIAQDGDRFFFHSGGGITVNSDPRKEYEEVLEKIYLANG